MPNPLAKKVLGRRRLEVDRPPDGPDLMSALDDLASHGVMGNSATPRPVLPPLL